MLQRTPYMTAEALGIDPNEHQALIAVLGKLERGELRHVPAYGEAYDEFGDACGFNMFNWDCDSVCCIGGWAEHMMSSEFSMVEGALFRLFFPEGDRKSMTPDQAAQALRNYLTQGEPRWTEVLAP